MANLLVLLETVFLLNVMPAFAPPMWMAMSWVGFSQPEADPVTLAGVTVCAATVGRLVLARLSCSPVRNHRMYKTDRQDIDVVRAWLEDREGMAAGLMLTHAFSLFPSNYAFIAYGLTRMRLRLIGLPLFVGRWVSYLTWIHIAQIDARYLDEETKVDRAYMSVYFIMSRIMFLVLAYGFTKLDWQHLLQTKHLQWRRRESIISPAKDTRTKVEC